jgi:hypothetical protein
VDLSLKRRCGKSMASLANDDSLYSLTTGTREPRNTTELNKSAGHEILGQNFIFVWLSYGVNHVDTGKK